MHRSYTRFALIAAIVALLRLVFVYGFTNDDTPQALPESLIANLNPEGRLAARQKIDLACADVSSLELISGVSDRLAFELLDDREQITRAVAQGLNSEAALQLAHGVGASTAKRLLEYLSLSPSCERNVDDNSARLFSSAQ